MRKGWKESGEGRLVGKIIIFLQAGAADKSILPVLFVQHYKIRKLFFNEHETAEEQKLKCCK